MVCIHFNIVSCYFVHIISIVCLDFQVDFEGVTGQIKFKRGVRETVKADIVKLLPSGKC